MNAYLLSRFIRLIDWIEKYHPQPMPYKKTFWLHKLRNAALAALDAATKETT